ncbi:ferric reductase-like transmembrane domain-containing protein [Hyphomicrobium sp. CS1GBMeth3]|uniref:ferredoxin reductase family protein n=1 Tax=Hyphomicrobium sp. CS1GBMeth3 TaxID=1892845 RepID=UPI000930A17A|nr:ferric reductase-like transmembrane domain-containing protein [Hyphomicrobium sp. CS1GBMeth3]
MKNIKTAFIVFIAALTGLWLLADTVWPEPLTYFSFRSVFVQYTGIIAIGAMSAATLLAFRPIWPERHLGGLDKMYRLHKWLGITALVVGLVHWWWAKGTKWMVGWGWLTRPERRPRGDQIYGPLEGWLRSQRGLAEFAGEWAFYAAVVLIVLALWKRFPYHLFARTHKWIAVAYLILVYHAVILIKTDYWSEPIGWATGILMLAGAGAAFIALSRRIGHDRKADGVIEEITYYPELRVLETAIRMSDDRWKGHKAGQFAFVTSNKSEGAHPYTIASAWDPKERRIVFITKALGDHTGRLRDTLKVGMPVSVEGPYGCFTFSDQHPRQIWIGAGIGITPFIARMKHLARSPSSQEITLFHPTMDFEQVAIDKLTADARAADVRLHVLVDAKDGLLDADRIRQAVPDWRSASIWFCGPPGFGEALRKDFVAHGFDASKFHQELFEMR